MAAKPEDQIRISAPKDPMEAVRDATAGRERRGGDGPETFRSDCAVCGARINYAFARRAAIPGVCGKCHDEVRRQMRDELTQEILGGKSPRSSSRIVHYFPRRTFLKSLALGLALGFAGAVALALYEPGAFAKVLAYAERGVEQAVGWGQRAWQWARGLVAS